SPATFESGVNPAETGSASCPRTTNHAAGTQTGSARAASHGRRPSFAGTPYMARPKPTRNSPGTRAIEPYGAARTVRIAPAAGASQRGAHVAGTRTIRAATA